MPSDRSAKKDAREPCGRAGAADVITKVSPWSVTDTVARLSAVAAARGMQVLAVVDHGARACDAGLDLRDTRLVIFGSAAAAAAVIQAAPLAALDLPSRVVVWVEGHQTLVSYPAPEVIASRHGLEGELAEVLRSVDAVTAAVIDR